VVFITALANTQITFSAAVFYLAWHGRKSDSEWGKKVQNQINFKVQ